jgi:hypothetical protein
VWVMVAVHASSYLRKNALESFNNGSGQGMLGSMLGSQLTGASHSQPWPPYVAGDLVPDGHVIRKAGEDSLYRFYTIKGFPYIFKHPPNATQRHAAPRIRELLLASGDAGPGPDTLGLEARTGAGKTQAFASAIESVLRPYAAWYRGPRPTDNMAPRILLSCRTHIGLQQNMADVAAMCPHVPIAWFGSKAISCTHVINSGSDPKTANAHCSTCQKGAGCTERASSEALVRNAFRRGSTGHRTMYGSNGMADFGDWKDRVCTGRLDVQAPREGRCLHYLGHSVLDTCPGHVPCLVFVVNHALLDEGIRNAYRINLGTR